MSHAIVKFNKSNSKNHSKQDNSIYIYHLRQYMEPFPLNGCVDNSVEDNPND
jgi:hypothetical protein